MFHSPKIGDTPRSNASSLHKSFNDTANGIPRSFLQPKITSTPLVRRESVFATPPKPHILSPRRYSLSEIATPPRSNRDLSKVHTPGPLLASTRYNLNVSTYEDTKSPGLAGRIVQYNEETQKEKQHQRPPTHQAKYGSPGLFPVVHLFKKKLPTLEQKPRTVTIRIASPEYSRHNPQEYNRKLLEGIIKPTSPNTNRRNIFASSSGEGNNSSTRSVLEALKEISRKRIHASEEYELNEDSGKRLRTENVSETDSNKRLRDDSPLLDNSVSPNKSSSKRICMYDEYSASCSSMNFPFKKTEQPSLKRKSVSISTLTENKKDPKPIKLINAETQTIPSKSDDQESLNTTAPEKQSEINSAEANDDQQKGPDQEKESPLQIFNDVPLNRIRKNRLAALMGSLTGKDSAVSLQWDDISSFDVTDEATVSKSTEKPLISILSSSPKKDSPNRTNKHVHFSIPESTSQPNLTMTSIPNYSLTRSSASITSPISSTCEAKSSFSTSTNDKLETPAPPSSPVGLSPSPSETTVTMPVAVSFASGSNSSSATSVVSKESSTSLLNVNTSKNETAAPNLQFKFPTTSSTVLGVTTSSMMFPTSMSASQAGFGSVVTPSLAPAPKVSSPPKMGGFKFDLTKPTSTSLAITTTNVVAVTSSLPTFSFGSTAQTEANKSKPLFGNVPNSTMAQLTPGSASTGFSFGVKSATPSFPPSTAVAKSSAPTNALVATPSATSLSSTSSNVSMTPAFKFGTPSTENNLPSGFGAPNTPALNFGSNSTPSAAVPAFGITTTVPSVIGTSAPSLSTTKAPVFSFGGGSTTSTPSGFGMATTSAAPIAFGAPSTTPASNAFGAPTTGGFGIPNTSLPSNNFGVTTTASSLGGFGTPPTTTGSAFGTSAATPMFGANKSVAPFGAATTNTAMPFGTSSTPNISPFNKNTAAFGQASTQPSFGTPTTTVSFGTANAFDATATTSASVFGGQNSSSAGFGKSGAGNIFGGVVTTQAPNFGGATSKPAFGAANTASPFGNTAPATSAPAFGNTSASTFNFGAKTTASNSFGAPFGTTTTTASTGFGPSTTPGFPASNFGNNAFGGSSTPAFGAASNATPAFRAPSSAAPAFGAANSSTPAFGAASSAPPAFGASSNPNAAFGAASTTTPAFGAGNTSAPAFGAVSTTSQPPPFGASNTAPAFGSTNTGFGTSGSKGPVFGGSSTPSFGAAPAPTFNSTAPTTGFGAPNNATAFGANASAFAKPQAGFGAAPNNAFGAGTGFGTNQPAPGFGAANPQNTKTPVFNFGATTAPKPAGVFSFGAPSSGEPLKPTFNFTGGSSAPAFGGSGAPSFGSTGAPTFGAAAAPQFNPPQPAAPGMFSIGSGSTSGRMRTQLRAKRRT